MIPGELFASISPYLTSEEKWNLILRPSQRRTRDPELRNMNKCENGWSKFLSKFQGRGIKIAWVNSIRVAMSMIFFNALGAIASWVTSSWAIVFFCVEPASTSFSLYTLGASTCGFNKQSEQITSGNYNQDKF